MSTTKLQGSAHDRLLAAANELFYAEGVHTVGIERVIERAGVAKASLYSAFGSKDELVRAYLRGRAETRQRRIAERLALLRAIRASESSRVFDLLGELAASPTFRGLRLPQRQRRGAARGDQGDARLRRPARLDARRSSPSWRATPAPPIRSASAGSWWSSTTARSVGASMDGGTAAGPHRARDGGGPARRAGAGQPTRQAQRHLQEVTRSPGRKAPVRPAVRVKTSGMADSKQDVLDMLRELAELTMLEEGDPQSFRVRAYESAAQAISAQATDLGRLTARELQQIEGIGKSTAEKIRELLGEGEGREAGGAPRRSTRAAWWSCSGSRASARRRSSGCAPSWACSRSTICGGCSASSKLRALSGFGQKSEEKLAQALARLEAQGPMERTPISVALPLAERIVAHMLELPGRHARLDLRVAAAVLRDDRRRRHRGRRRPPPSR